MARARLSNEQWQRLISEYERSGESQATFVVRHRLRLTTFQKWLYQVRRERKTEPAFVEVSGVGANEVIVEHGVVRLRFGDGVSAQRVAEIISALRRC